MAQSSSGQPGSGKEKKHHHKLKTLVTGAAIVGAAYGAKKIYDVAKAAKDKTEHDAEKY